MNIQAIITAIIVLAAVAYVGQIVWRKAKSFSAKSGCGADCGCSANPKTRR